MSKYDKSFFQYVVSGSVKFVERVIPYLTNIMKINSVLDVGCRKGVWLSVWWEMGVFDVVGVDGQYVYLENLHIPKNISFHMTYKGLCV